MTCKNCLHDGVCYTQEVCNDIEQQLKDFGCEDFGCEDFTDSSEWVHLPCKVGDTIYKLWYEPCHLGETYPDIYGCDGCYDACDMKKVITEYKVPSLRFIIDELMNGSCVYYLTREEAEKALEEKK